MTTNERGTPNYEFLTDVLAKRDAEIERLRNDYGILKRDYDALREVRENEGNEIERRLRLHRIAIYGRDEIERGLREDNEQLRAALQDIASKMPDHGTEIDAACAGWQMMATARRALEPKP